MGERGRDLLPMPQFLRILLLCAAIPALCQEESSEEALAGWELTFQDDFDGEKLNYDKWIPKDPWGVVRNEELQGYWIKAFHPVDGILKIEAEHEPSFYDGEKRDFRSGMMTTLGNFSQKFGRFEIRCKVPKGRGLWPAFWLLPDPPSWPPEIDVLELLGHEPNKVYMSLHWPHPTEEHESESVTEEFSGPDYSAEFHTFAVEWEAEEIRWFIDGELQVTQTNHIPQVPMFLLVNLAVGGWAGEPDDSVFPAQFEVDFVKVWRKK